MVNNKYKNISLIILSHPNPDVDSIISGYLLEKLLKANGYDVRYVIPDQNINEESYHTCLKYGIDAKAYQGKIPDNSMLILVDHYKTQHNGKVIGIIDHHPTTEDISCEHYINHASSSTAMIIYNLNSSLFDIEDIKKVAVANMIDTTCFSTTKAVEADKDWTINICKEYNINYDELYKDGISLTDISDLNMAAINGEKSYNYEGNKVKSSYIQVSTANEMTVNKIIEILESKLIIQDLEMWVFIVHDMTSFKSDAYLITNNNTEIINYDFLASRASTIMPEVENKFNNTKKRRN